MRWIAFFSKTGNEIYRLSRLLNRYPDYIITNKKELVDINKELPRNKIIQLPEFKSSNYKSILRKNDLITLHGFLKIIPPDICNEYIIYNSHPGLITKYPFLKGLNPQKKAYDFKLKTSGVCIHKVVAEVDSGKIILEKEVNIEQNSLEDVYIKLHSCSVSLWYEFLKDKIK